MMAEAASSITVEVTNVRNARGMVRIAICPKDKFLADECKLNASAPAKVGSTTLTIANVPSGEYAIQAFHDENNNNEIDRGMFGIPKEGVGFSRDAKIMFGPPKWKDAVFTHGASPQSLRFSLRYFSGPGNPAAWQERHPKG
jgi:uncharacterized protein (DUF2141 family)